MNDQQRREMAAMGDRKRAEITARGDLMIAQQVRLAPVQHYEPWSNPNRYEPDVEAEQPPYFWRGAGRLLSLIFASLLMEIDAPEPHRLPWNVRS